MTAIAEELNRIAKQHNGLLCAEAVVAAAEPSDSPLHNSFVWDNTDAARLWRLHQARNLIRVTVTMVETPTGSTSVRAFVSLTPDRDEEGGGYRSMVTVLGSKKQRDQMLCDALAELAVFQAKYAALSELAEVFAAAASVRKRKRM